MCSTYIFISYVLVIRLSISESDTSYSNMVPLEVGGLSGALDMIFQPCEYDPLKSSDESGDAD